MCLSWREFADGILQVILFTSLYFKQLVKQHCVAKILRAIWEMVSSENNFISHRFSYKLALIPFGFNFALP